MPFDKEDMVAFAVFRGTQVVATQENAIQTQHSETGNALLDPVSVFTVLQGANDVSSFFAISAFPDGVGNIRPRNLGEIALPDRPAYHAMWSSGAVVTVTFNTGIGSQVIRVNLRKLDTIDILALRGVDSTIDPITVIGGNPPAGFDSFRWQLTAPPSLSVTFGSPGTSAQFSVADSAPWGTLETPWSLTIRTRRGVADNDTLDSLSTFAGASADQQPKLLLRQPQAADDGSGTVTAYTSPGPRVAYTYFPGLTGTGRGVDAQLPTDPGTRRGFVSGNEVGTFDADLRLTPTLPALTTNVTAGAAPAAMLVEVAYTNNRYPRVTCNASIASRRLDDTSAPPFSILIPNPGGAVTLRVETGAEAYDWLAVSDTLATANVVPPALPAPNVPTLGVTFNNLTVGGETGNVVVELRRTGAGNARSVGGTVSAEVAPPLPAINVTPSPLPGGRARMLYETTLTASTSAGVGQELFWQVISPAQLSFPTATNTGPTNLLRSVAHLLDAWGGTTQNITVRVTKQPMGGGAPIEGGNDVVLQLPVAASKDPVNTAIVLDRSGSMAIVSALTSRWFKAVSGAHFMASQIAAENATRPAGQKHNVSVLWFGGWDTVADNYSAPSTDPFGEGNFGVLTVGGNALDFADPNAGTYLADLDTAKNAAEALTQPKFWTAIGAGLLWGREKLRAADVAFNRERVLICLSDGEENRPPLVADATVAPRWHQLQDGTNIGDPSVRVYASAAATTTAAANTLRTAVSNTGGIASLDVKEVPDAGSLIQQWFAHTFSSLFGFNTIVAGFDPTLSSGETAAHVVKVTQAHTRLVVTLFLDAPSTDHWSVTLEPPGGGEITEADAAALPGIELRTGPLYKSFVLSLPLTVPGHEHRWAGDWIFRVTRTGDASGTYIVNALGKTDVRAELRVIGPASPAPGDVVKLRVDVTHDGGKPIDGATVRSVVTPPGVWRDGLVAAAASSTPTGAGGDNGIAWQNATQALAVGGMFVDGTPVTIDLVGVGGGGYEADLPLTVPGGWQIDTTVQGVRPIKRRFPFDAIVKNIARYYLVPEAARFEIAVASLSVKPQQPFALEDRETLAVRFVPNRENTVRGGLALGDVLRLWVKPQDISNLLLGPGHATQIVFEHPDLPKKKWRAVDFGDGTYGATIRFFFQGNPILDRHFGKLIAQGLLYADPLTNTQLPRFTRTFPLQGWIVRVLGVTMPIDIGLKLQPFVKERHALLPPRYSISIGHAVAAADAVKSKKLKEEEAKALRVLDAFFEKTVDLPYVPTPNMARWIGNTIGHVAGAIDDALPALHDTHLGPALIALATAYEAARDRVRDLKQDPCSDKTVFETWDDLRTATDAFRRAAAPGARGSERPPVAD